MVQKVFISSTKKDLLRHRDALKQALIKSGHFPVEMDDFGARDVDPVTGCLRLVAESQLFVGVYAWRYGYVPPGAARSITAEELEQARRLDKPRFCFLVDETYPWPADPDVPPEDPASKVLLEALKNSVRSERMVATFTTPEQLALGVVTALRRWELGRAAAAGRGRQLDDLLGKVERFWVKSVLEPSIPKTGLLIRDREERADEVAQPWAPPAWAERGKVKLLPPRAPLDLFVGSGRRLLILGEGGYGKTTDLLQLAGGLLELARDDPEQPVPVVLKLGSWGRLSPRRLSGWMTVEIHTHYKLDAALVRGWIDADRLLPLLDGLDEVEPGCRDTCVHAINQFLAGHPACGLAVCCRGDVNDELRERLDLRSAYALWPLSAASLDRYLAGAGADAEPLRAALAEPGWRELACNPLLLLLMERVLPRAGAASLGATPTGSVAAPSGASPRRMLLETYVQVMLDPRDRPLRFGEVRTRRGLAWLAAKMGAHQVALFQLGDLQPSWLGGAAQVWVYAVASRALGGAFLMLPMALPWHPFLLPFGLATGAVAGLFDGWRLRNIAPRPASATDAAPAAAQPLAGILHRPAGTALAIGGVAMLCFNLFGALSRHAAGLLRWRVDLPDGLRYGLFFGALFGLVFGLRRGRGERGDTEIAAGLTRSRWSWRKSRRGAAWPPVLVALLWVIEWLRGWLGVPSMYTNVNGSLVYLLVALVLSLVGGMVGGLLGDVEERPAGVKRRHPGLRPAFAATVHAFWRPLLLVAAALWAVLLLLLAFGGVRFGRDELWAPAYAAVALALWSAFALRGLDIVQHSTLRLLLWFEGVFPLRWVPFLDQAVDRELMHRVGPGYEFIHPWLLADLAAGLPEAAPVSTAPP